MTASSSFEQGYYDANYPDYDRQNPPRKLAHYRDAVARFLPPSPRPRVLDVGCAFGRFLGALNPAWEGFGTDISEYAIARARTEVPGATLVVARDGTIPFDGAFDAITAWDVLEHVPDFDAMGDQIRARLVRGGAFLFVVPVYDGPLGAVVNALDRDPTHLHRHSRRFWLEWAARRFAVADWWGLFRYFLPGGLYVHRPTRVLRRIAPAVLIAATAR